MSKCKECISEKVCRYNDGINLYCKDDYECPHFKNKDCFTEGVRCKECIYSEQVGNVLYCNCFNRNVSEDDFCSQGG